LLNEIRLNLKKPVGNAFYDSLHFLKLKRKEDKINGIGVNILTEILMTLDPKKFANLNKNPLFVLKFFGKPLPDASSFKAVDYQEYVELLSKIRDKLNVKTFLEIDSFFNYVYWSEKENLS
jgi:hypothetical protein